MRQKIDWIQTAGHRSGPEPVRIERDLVLAMLGGVWPDSGQSADWPSGFCWHTVDHFEVEAGVLVPYRGGMPAPGPDLKLVII